MRHHHTGNRRPHSFTARPGHGARWTVTPTLSVRFLHDSVDGALQLRAVNTTTKKTVLKVKNRPSSRRCPNMQVLNLLLAFTAASDTLPGAAAVTDRVVTATETADGMFALSLRGRQNGTWTDISYLVQDSGTTDFVITGQSVFETERAVEGMLKQAANLGRPDVPDALIAALVEHHNA